MATLSPVMLTELKADLARYPGSGARRLLMALSCAGIYPLAVYRFGHDVYFRWPRGLRLFGKLVYKPLAFLAEWATGIYLSPAAIIGPGLYIGHYGLIRVGREVVIGERCNLSPMVFLGFGASGGRTGVPQIGDRVYIAVGAKVLGPVRVGSDVAIGANAVVVKDVPESVTVGGVPAKVISKKGSAPYLQVGQAIEVVPAEVAEARRLNQSRRRNKGRIAS